MNKRIMDVAATGSRFQLTVVLLPLLFLLLSPPLHAELPPVSKFLPKPEWLREDRTRYPFDRVWVHTTVNWENYHSIMIRPVATNHFREPSGWHAINLADRQLLQGVRDMADYTKLAFEEAVRTDRDRRFNLVYKPGKGVLLFEAAIVELVPNKAVLGTVGLVAPFARKSVLGIASKTAAGKPQIAIEVRVRDAKTGHVLMMFTDLEKPPFRPVDFNAPTLYNHAQESVIEWSHQFIEVFNTPAWHRVKDGKRFRFKPY